MTPRTFLPQPPSGPEEPARAGNTWVMLVLAAAVMALGLVAVGVMVAGGLVLLAGLVGLPIALLVVLFLSLF